MMKGNCRLAFALKLPTGNSKADQEFATANAPKLATALSANSL